MQQVFSVIIAVILLALPFFYLAKAIFFFKENRNLKYRSVYIRAAIYALVAFVVIGLYFSVPAMMIKMQSAVRTAPAGAYVGISSRDTLVLYGFQMKHKFGDNPMNNYSSPYMISENAIFKDFGGRVKMTLSHYLLGQKIEIDNEVLTLTYPIRDSYYNNLTNKKPKKNQPNPNPNNNNVIINRYMFSLKSDTLTLVPLTGPAVAQRYIRFANYY